MSTLLTTWLSKPKDDKKISAGTFGYINARIRQRAYDLVIREFKASGISQATLARRWGKGQDYVSRFLAGPGNWELNTFAEALFAIQGAIPSFVANHVEKTQAQLLNEGRIIKLGDTWSSADSTNRTYRVPPPDKSLQRAS